MSTQGLNNGDSLCLSLPGIADRLQNRARSIQPLPRSSFNSATKFHFLDIPDYIDRLRAVIPRPRPWSLHGINECVLMCWGRDASLANSSPARNYILSQFTLSFCNKLLCINSLSHSLWRQWHDECSMCCVLYSCFRRWQSAVSRRAQYSFSFNTRHRLCYYLLSVLAATSSTCGGWGRWTRRPWPRTAQFCPSSVDAGPRAAVSLYWTSLVPWLRTSSSVVLPADLQATNTVSTRPVWASRLGDWQRWSGASGKFDNTNSLLVQSSQLSRPHMFLFITATKMAFLWCQHDVCVTYRTVFC